MANWQFWILIGVLALNFLALVNLGATVKSLWTKLHEIYERLGHFPSYRDDLEEVANRLRSIESSIDALADPGRTGSED